MDSFLEESLQKKRLLCQTGFFFVHNGYFGFIFSGSIYTGFFKRVCAPGLNCASCPAALFACPIGILQNFLASLKVFNFKSLVSIGSYILGFFLLYGAIFGRLICGWVCPFGFIQDLLYKVPFFKKRLITSLSLQRAIRVLVLFTVLVFPWLFLNSIGIGEETFCKYICPSGTLLAGLPNIALHPSFTSMIGKVFCLKLFVLFVVIVGAIVDQRFFCKYVCPLGFIYGFFNSMSIFRVKHIAEKCNDCKMCTRVCPVGIDPRTQVDTVECIRCLNCAKVCKNQAIIYGFNLKDVSEAEVK